MAEKASDPAEPEATLVFVGTVKKLGAATMRSVPVSDRTAVVRVEQLIEAPRNLAHLAGTDITVLLAGRAKVEVGKQLLFHAAAWIFGDSVAVRAVSQEAATTARQAALARGGDPAQQRVNREVQQRLDAADLVVSGKVVTVSLPQGGESAAATRGLAPVSGKPVREHDPHWREAVIAVDDAHKGNHPGRQVKVLFPASTDVRWFRAPKFAVGQQGFFALHKTMLKAPETPTAATRELTAAAVAPDGESEVYTALHPMDFQPYDQQERVLNALGGTGRAAGKKE
jgi:hypothetical protein